MLHNTNETISISEFDIEFGTFSEPNISSTNNTNKRYFRVHLWGVIFFRGSNALKQFFQSNEAKKMTRAIVGLMLGCLPSLVTPIEQVNLN